MRMKCQGSLTGSTRRSNTPVAESRRPFQSQPSSRALRFAFSVPTLKTSRMSFPGSRSKTGFLKGRDWYSSRLNHSGSRSGHAAHRRGSRVGDPGCTRPSESARPAPRIVCSTPPRPAPYLVPKPAILDLEVTLFQPAWRRGIPLSIPGFKPEPRAGKRSCLEAVPWFVPARPKAPILSIEPRETPAGWRSPKRPLFAPPPLVIPAVETKPNQPVPSEDSSKEISALAKAMPRTRAEPINRDSESPFGRNDALSLSLRLWGIGG